MTAQPLSAAELERHFQAFDRAIAQARAGGEVSETHPATGEPLNVSFLPDEVVMGTPTQPGLYRMRLRTGGGRAGPTPA